MAPGGSFSMPQKARLSQRDLIGMSSERNKEGIAARTGRSDARNVAPGLTTRNKKLLVMNAAWCKVV